MGAERLKAVENLIFQSKNRFIAVFASGSLKDFRENRQGGESLLPRLPACQNLFNGLSWRCHAILPPWACSPPRFREEPEKTSFAKRVGFFALRPETPRSRSRRRFSSARKKRLRARKSGAKARRTVCFQNRALSGFMKPDVSTMSGRKRAQASENSSSSSMIHSPTRAPKARASARRSSLTGGVLHHALWRLG